MGYERDSPPSKWRCSILFSIFAVVDFCFAVYISKGNIEGAGEVLVQWVKVAEKCLALNNFHSMAEIVQGKLLLEKTSPSYSSKLSSTLQASPHQSYRS